MKYSVFFIAMMISMIGMSQVQDNGRIKDVNPSEVHKIDKRIQALPPRRSEFKTKQIREEHKMAPKIERELPRSRRK